MEIVAEYRRVINCERTYILLMKSCYNNFTGKLRTLARAVFALQSCDKYKNLRCQYDFWIMKKDSENNLIKLVWSITT